MDNIKRQFQKFNTALFAINIGMVVFSLLIDEVAGAGIFMGFAGINIIGIYADKILEDAVSFLNKVANLFGGFKTF